MSTVPRLILFLAEPFGFGPISSGIAVARQIKVLAPAQKILFAGYGTSWQLAVTSNTFDEVTCSEDLLQYLLTSFDDVQRRNCLVVANTYPDAVRAAKQAGFRCVFIDTLFWMWNSLPIDIRDVGKYYIEDFRCVELQADRFGASDKYTIVPPLIDVSVPAQPVPHPFLLVSLGGIDSNLYDFPVFYEKLIAYISKDPTLQQYHILICGGGRKFREQVFKQYEHARLTITCLAPREYIARLKAADIVLASPGLHSFYENYFLTKNVLFLPPQSYSQYLQLQYIMANFEGVLGANFEQLGLAHSLRPNMPDEERIREVKRTNLQLVDEAILINFFQTVQAFLTGRIHTDWAGEKNNTKEKQDGPYTVAKDILIHVDN